MTQEVRHVGIVLFDDFEELDAIGPLEVFGMADMLQVKGVPGEIRAEAAPEIDTTAPRHKVVTVAVPGTTATEGRQVRAWNGLCILADYAADDPALPRLDIVLVPGGDGTRDLWKDKSVTSWLAGLCERATWITSVCTGVTMLHAAGYVGKKRAATHYLFEDKLEALGVNVVRGERWVVDGSLVTSQGVSAGIDMSLWLVGQLHSPGYARAVQRFMQYEPAPPYQLEADASASK